MSQRTSNSERLIRAIRNGRVDEVTAILAAGIDLTKVRKGALTALIWAVMVSHTGILTTLLGHGIAVDRRAGPERMTALICAVQRNSVEMVRLLLDAGANVDKQDREGKAAVYWAVEGRCMACLALLLTKSPDLSLLTNAGWAPLHVASTYGDSTYAEMLVGAGASLSTLTPERPFRMRETPFELASRRRKVDTARFLGRVTFAADLRARLIEIAIGLCGLDLPVLQVLLIFEAWVQRSARPFVPTMFVQWEICKAIKHFHG